MRFWLVVSMMSLLTSFGYARGSGQGSSVHTLVIDPGHGGLDPGAIGLGGKHEAELALAVSMRFGKMIEEQYPEVKIIYTRTTDKFVSLADRADMANKAKADLFICIHLNSAVNHEASGTSTYVLGLHRTDDNLEIAKRENAVIDLEGERTKNYEFNPNSAEGHIIMSMKQNAFLDQSILIASNIEEELAKLAHRKSRGVKQAGFWVLYKTAMPSLLAEIGFISNPNEEKYLSSAEGQDAIASSLFQAFQSYKTGIEQGVESLPPPAAHSSNPIVEKKTVVVKDSTPPVIKQSSQPIAKNQPDLKPSIPPQNAKPAVESVQHIEYPHQDIIPAKDTAKIATAIPHKPDPKTVLKPMAKQAVSPPHTAYTVPDHAPVAITPDVVFRVQLIASHVQPSNYKQIVNTFGLVNIEELGNGISRYLVGESAHFAEAKKWMLQARQMGFKSAFIVGYDAGRRLDMVETVSYGHKYP
jgi:N-acetylmuramoyl-L-alanine amidase